MTAMAHHLPADLDQLHAQAVGDHASGARLDRQVFIDIVSEGQSDIGGMQPLPEGLWGTPPDILKKLLGYDPDVQKTAAIPARACISSATGRTTGSRSR